MQNRILSLLLATIAGVVLFTAAPARALSDDGTSPSYRDPLTLSDQTRSVGEDVPRTLSFKFASLYNRIVETAAKLTDYTQFKWTTIPSLGLKISFQSIDESSHSPLSGLETTERLLPSLPESEPNGLSLRIDVTDDHAPLVDPSPRRADQPIKDHIWLSLGARYDHSERLTLDFGYEHLWVNETTVDRPGGLGNDVLGDYRSEMDLIGARLRWSFD